MKIGIFGDSFGLEGISGWGSGMTYKSWSTIIKEHYPLTENFCQGGSSLYYTYLTLSRLEQSFDKFIILITSPGRIYLPDLPYEYRHAPSLASIEYKLRMIDNLQVRLTYKAVIDYGLHVQDYGGFDTTVHKLLVEKLQQIYSQSLFLPCFSDSMPGSNCCLLDISLLDDFSIGVDCRHAHLNYENNIILANKVIDWIDGRDFNFQLSDFTKSLYPIDQYYKKT